MTARVRDDEFDDWLDAIADDEGFSLECANGHASLPPRGVCPECGDADLHREALPETGTVETFTVVHVAAPSFVDDVPYVTAVAGFGPVRLTGVVAADPDEVEVGLEVATDVRETEATGDRRLVLDPV